MRLGAQRFLGHSGPQQKRPRQLLALHDLFHCERRRQHQRLPGVVPFTMARRAGHEFLACHHPRRLIRGGQPVDVGANRDDRMARSPFRHPGGRHVRVAALNVEALLHEGIGDPALGLDFLKSEFAEAEQTIDQLLREHAARLDVGDDVFLQRVKPRIGRCGRQRAGSRRGWRRGAALG
jgi:hypothetical protein